MKSTTITFAILFLAILTIQAQSDITKLPNTDIQAKVLFTNLEITGSLDNENITALAQAVWAVNNTQGGTFKLEYSGSVDIFLFENNGKRLKQANFFPVDGSPVEFILEKDKNYVLKVVPSFGADDKEEYTLKLVE